MREKDKMCKQTEEGTKVFISEGETGECPFCKKLLNPHGNIECDCGTWQVCPIQKSQSGGWGTGEIMPLYEMSLKTKEALTFTEEEARSMACLFLQTAVNNTTLEEIINHTKR